MKKSMILGVLCLLLGLAGGSTRAFDLGDTVKDTTKGAAKGAAQSAVADKVNQKLAQQNCTYSSKTAVEPNCNVDNIVNLLSGFNDTAKKSGFANQVVIDVTAHGKDMKIARNRAEYLRDKIRQKVSWWDYNVYYEKGGEDADIRVQIR